MLIWWTLHQAIMREQSTITMPPPPDDESDVTVSDEPEVSTDSTDLWSDSIDSYGDSLSEIVEDLIGRLKQGDHNLLSIYQVLQEDGKLLRRFSNIVCPPQFRTIRQ